jgi:hypothetical protein
MNIKARAKGKSGMALMMVLILTSILLIVSVPLMYMARTATRMPERWRNYDQCFLYAASAMEQAKWSIQQVFQAYYTAAPLPKNIMKFTWFDTHTTNSIGSPGSYSAPYGQPYPNDSNAVITVTIKGVRQAPLGGRDVILNVECRYNGIVRQIEEVVRYDRVQSGVFDYAYFINNFGWFWGDSITAEGDIRANGNFSFGGYNPTVNGDPYASINPDNGANGQINGNNPIHWSIPTYQADASLRGRPTDPPSTNVDSWGMGYNGTPTNHPYQDILEMPYLGNLADYEWLATNKNGYIKQGGNTIVSCVYSNVGPSGLSNGADFGSLILDGSGTNPPIEIHGPVVIRGDVIIKGKFTGQGTIYAGRNIHIAGDVIASNPPAWHKPDTNPSDTATTNSTRDMLGLCAKGSTLMGNYTDGTWQYYVNTYGNQPFTQPYKIDPTDVSIGYGSYQDAGGNWWFNGNYGAFDGGMKMSGTNQVPRKFYESSLDDAKFQSIVQPSCIHQIDAICYNNHLLSGLVGDGPGITFNGTVVSRDEAIIYYNWVYMNWDIRLGSKAQDAASIDIYLPFSLATAQTVHFKEL